MTYKLDFCCFLSNQEGEELFYKRGFEFKLPYPCLYDFESNFSSSVHANSQSSNENSKNVLSSTNESKQQHQQNQHHHQQQSSKSKAQSAQSANRANSATCTTTKTKTPKQSKAQLMRVQQQAHQSVVQPVYNQEPFQQTNAYLNAQHSNGHGYKFNSAYSGQSGSLHHQTIEHYYKTELNEDYKSHLLNSHDYSLVSAASIGSTSSSSSSTASSSDNISVNISSTYPYGSAYFNHNSYPYSSENGKFYSASPYSFYSSTTHNHYNYNPTFGANEPIQVQNGTILNSNLHSNNSSCSSTSSTNSSSIENQHSYNSGAIWPESVSAESSTTPISLKFAMPLLNENPSLNQHHQQHHQANHHSNNHHQPAHSAYNNNSDLNSQCYSELLANNAAAMAAAKYSCAAAASTYSSYPFTNEDYNASVSQIQVRIAFK
jgi:hypothetical protein